MAAILQGAMTCSATDYFQAAANALPGDPAGFTVSVLLAVYSQSVPLLSRHLFGQRPAGNPGWCVLTQNTNSTLIASFGGSSATTTSPSYTITASDLGKIILFTAVWDGPANLLRGYLKRAQQGAGNPLTGGYAPATGSIPMIGKNVGGSPATEGIAIYGAYYALGIATLAQVQAQHDDVMANECIRPCPGLPGVLIDLTQDVRGNGGAMPAELVDRGSGGINFARAGSPAVASHYARAWQW